MAKMDIMLSNIISEVLSCMVSMMLMVKGCVLSYYFAVNMTETRCYGFVYDYFC